MALFTTTSSSSPPGSESWVTDSTLATFVSDVIETSRRVPVLVDFWAPWCGPCKQLGPLLEKLVREANGALRLVKIDVDKNQQLALQMRVQSIPAVFAFVNGQPVDGFMGALPEGELRKFIDRLKATGLEGTIDPMLEAAEDAFEKKNYSESAMIYGEILGLDPSHVAALSGMARCYIALEQLSQAESLLNQVPEKQRTHAAFLGAKAALRLASAPRQESSEIVRLKKNLETNPGDHDLLQKLAHALNSVGQKEEAMQCLLDSIKRDKAWNEMASRKQLLTFFEAWGPKDPLTLAGRRALSSLLFS